MERFQSQANDSDRSPDANVLASHHRVMFRETNEVFQ